MNANGKWPNEKQTGYPRRIGSGQNSISPARTIYREPNLSENNETTSEGIGQIAVHHSSLHF
jgi:hypothetical protein